LDDHDTQLHSDCCFGLVWLFRTFGILDFGLFLAVDGKAVDGCPSGLFLFGRKNADLGFCLETTGVYLVALGGVYM
jgi:hypothetical protein